MKYYLLIIGFVFYSFQNESTGQLMLNSQGQFECVENKVTVELQELSNEKFEEGQHHLITGSSPGAAVFDVKYSGFTDESKAAFEAAIRVWSNTLKSDIPIRVFAEWAVNDNINNLGYVVPTEVTNFESTPNEDVIYPITLAEKLSGLALNGEGEADIVAVFNSGRDDWYFGLDGMTPSNQIDLFSVILHELGHGLGISGTFFKSGVNGSFGSGSGNPKIYDKFVFNGKGEQLIDVYESGTSELGDQLTGNSLVFRSEIAKQISSVNSYPKLYAPDPYNPGSSISHLDEVTYNNSENAMMTPFLGYGSSSLQIGPLVTGMLYDMGWLNAKLSPVELSDQESLNDLMFKLVLNRDSADVNDIVKVLYSYATSSHEFFCM